MRPQGHRDSAGGDKVVCGVASKTIHGPAIEIGLEVEGVLDGVNVGDLHGDGDITVVLEDGTVRRKAYDVGADRASEILILAAWDRRSFLGGGRCRLIDLG